MAEIIEIEEMTMDGWQAKPYTFDIARDIEINDADINPDLTNICRLLTTYGDCAARLKAEVERCEMMVNAVEASTAQRIRHGEIKLTEAGIKERFNMDPTVLKAREVLQSKRYKQLRVESWYYAIKRKVDILIAMTHIHSAEIRKLY